MSLVVIGNSTVGKSSLIQRFSSGLFDDQIGNTVGIDFQLKKLNIDGK